MTRSSEEIYEPIIVPILVSMVILFGLTIAYLLGKIIRKGTLDRREINTLKTTFPVGTCQITEGCFLTVLNDLVHNVTTTGVGEVVGGGLSMFWGADSCILASGVFAVTTIIRPWAFTDVLLAGFFIIGMTILLLKRLVDSNVEIIQEEKEEEDTSWDDLTIS